MEFQVDGRWKKATGAQSEFSLAYYQNRLRNWNRSSGKPPDRTTTDAEIRSFLFKPDGSLAITIWKYNDFGAWAWNLVRNGKQTPFYIHTTPVDEANYAAGIESYLDQSHGCIHIFPKDRDEMMRLGYLKKGISFEVKSYKDKRP